MEKIKLKECPCCGGEARFVYTFEADTRQVRAKCSKCGLAIGLTQFLFWRYIAKQKSYETENAGRVVEVHQNTVCHLQAQVPCGDTRIAVFNRFIIRKIHCTARCCHITLP